MLQQVAGNKAVSQILARKDSKLPTTPTVEFDKYKIDVVVTDRDAWAKPGDAPMVLEVTSQKGRHSAALARLFKERTKIGKLILKLPPSDTSGDQLGVVMVTLTFTSARIKSYAVEGATETWAVTYEGVNREKATHSIGT